MSRLDETILEYLRRAGPATPIEIAQRIGANSLIVSAVLIDAMSQQKIKRSKRKFGSSGMYYYPEQLSAMQKRISNTLTPQDKILIQKLMQENVIGEYEVNLQEGSMFSALEDLVNSFTVEYKGRLFRCWSSPTLPEPKAKELAMNKLLSKLGAIADEPKPEVVKAHVFEAKPVARIEEIKPSIKLEEAKQEIKLQKIEHALEKPEVVKKVRKVSKTKEKEKEEVQLKLANEFRDKVLEWLDKNDVEVADEKTLKDGKGFELSVKVPMLLGIGKQAYMVRVLDYGKKGVGQEELSSIAMDAVSKRTPAIVISASGFAKNATKYWQKELQDMIFLVSKDDLE